MDMEKAQLPDLPEALKKLMGLPEVLKIEDLSRLIGKAATTIRWAATNAKAAHLIPRPFKLPGSRRLCWHRDEVLAWMAQATPVQPKSRKARSGPPTKRESVAAQKAGLSVKEWRAQR